MTDGYVSNEAAIIAEIQNYPKARVFAFGIGNSVNRHLLDKMSEVGNGEVDYVALEDDGSKAARKFYERVRTPLLTDISIDWNGVAVAEVYPAKLPDLFSAKPVIVNGRYSKAGSGVIRLKGKIAGQEYSREIAINLPEAEPANDVLATLWARKRIDQLNILRGTPAGNSEKINSEIMQLGLEFRILTENTSFVAVEERVVNHNGKPVTVQVPAAVPQGVDQSNLNGANISTEYFSNLPTSRSIHGLYTVSPTVARSGLRDSNAKKTKASKGSGKGSGSGSGNGSGTGVGYGSGGSSGSGAGIAASVTVQGTSPSLMMTPGAGLTSSADIISENSPTPRSPEITREQKRKDRLHTWIYALIDRVAKTSPVGANESMFVKDGQAQIKLNLSSRSSAIIEKLRAAGFEVVSENKGTITGKISIEKLAALSEMDEIILILPAV